MYGDIAMDNNELTRLLLKAGYTKEEPPDFVEKWNAFYGGWTYNYKTWNYLVFETPCGLLVSGAELYGGTMSYMGVDFTFENNNYVICCPKFNREGPCELNHELLRDNPFGALEKIIHCACHLSNKPYEYEHSLEKVHDDVHAESEVLFKKFNEKHNGRACRHHSHYNRTTRTWRIHYNPQEFCTHNICEYCHILQKNISDKKGNVYYDEKTTWIEKGNDLIPDETRITIRKSEKLLKRPVSVTICEAIAKYAGWRIREQKSLLQFREEIKYPGIHREIFNIRCETRPSRDLFQDLQDIQDGIKIIHASDEIKTKKEFKRQRRIAYKEKKIKCLEKKISTLGYDKMNDLDQIKAKKLFGLNRIKEIETAALLSKKQQYNQITIFEDMA